MPRISCINPGRTSSILLPTTFGKQSDRNEVTEEMDESIEVQMGPITTTEVVIQDLVASNKENNRIISMLGKEVAHKNIMIEKMNKDSNKKSKSLKVEAELIDIINTKTAENADLNEQLRLSKTKNEELESELQNMVANNEASRNIMLAKNEKLETQILSLTLNNKENIKQISSLENELMAKKTAIEEMFVKLGKKGASLEERSAETASLSMQIQHLNDKIECLEETNQTLLNSKEDIIQQMSALKVDLASKKIAIDEMSTDIQKKNALLEEKSAEIVDISDRLQISLAENCGLKTKVKFLDASNNDHVMKTFKLNEDLAAMTIVIDEVSESLQSKIALIEDKYVEITDLKERLELSEAQIVDQKITIEDLVAMNMNKDGLLSLHENELEAKTMKNEEMLLGVHQRNASLEDKSAEILLLTERLHLAMNEKKELKTMVDALVASSNDRRVEVKDLVAMNEKNYGLIISLENELEAETMKNEEMTLGIHQRNASLEDKSAEILLLTERLHLAMNEKKELKTMVDALVASSLEYVQNISILKEELETKKIEIHETNTQFQQNIIAMHEESSAIAILMEQLQQSNASMEGLKREMHGLVASNKEYVNKMSLLGDEVTAKQVTIDALNVEIQNLHSTCQELATENKTLSQQIDLLKLKSSWLKTTVQDLESKKNMYALEAEKLTYCLNEANTSSEVLQLPVKEASSVSTYLSKMSMKKSKKVTTELQGPLTSMPDLLIDEKSNSNKQLQDTVMNKGMEDNLRSADESLGEATAEILEKKKKYKILPRSLTKPLRKHVNR
jgi:uncharacterized protein YoxC